RLHGVALGVDDGDRVGGDGDDLVLVHLEGGLGLGDEGGDVGAEVVRAVAEPDDEGGGAAGGDDRAGGVGVEGEQGEGALEPGGDGEHGGGEVAGVGAGGQVGDDLGVRLGGEGRAVGLQLGPQRGEVLDDAIVDDRDPSVVGQVRVGVGVGGGAVGGPAGVPDGDLRLGQRAALELLEQPAELAGLLAHRHGAVGDD